MAKSPDDIASEIENLRQETDIIVDELMKRASLPSIARGMTATVTDTANSVVNEAAAVANNAATTLTHLVDEMPEPMREHRLAATYTSVGVLAGAVAFTLSWLVAARQTTPSERATRQVRGSFSQARDAVREWLQRAQEIRDDMRVVPVREEPSMVKRILWTGLVAAMTTLGSMLFKRMTATAWRTTMREEPPKI